ncbi:MULTISPECIES: type II toxin-antitoxin system VapC family toxin [Roseateles]|uniref:PIN domain-containing protein n=1 Tax=Pelomonas caseinilytica TaxID=2906763 RepID=A0ABS8XLV5_9BURK|nr:MULTISPECIES: PIN domain-containing protein [unclassified Roseateles]MCE4540048.1 PIN domain-containing protein [Pelomonas sp. P7]HEV6964158.1 PIN domain-containing protein [Roseateles sp.]
MTGGVLVDTSVWVQHFRDGIDGLAELLAADRVLTHPLVVAEIACGTPPNRRRTLADLDCLQPTRQATVRELLEFIEREQLFGQGCGFVDLSLLASTLMTTGAALWTLDGRLSRLAERFGVAHPSN